MEVAIGKRTRLSELDALRGIAALSVLLFHYSDQFDQNYHHMGQFPYTFEVGRYGVQLFFVISGFVIFWSLERTTRAADFVVSRLTRLFPAYWASLAITLFLVALVGLPGQEVSTRDALLNIPMFPDFLQAEPVDGSYWTLQIELFFYFQMLLWFLAGGLRRIQWIIAGWLLIATAFAVTDRLGQPLSYTVRELLDVRYICYFAVGILMFRMRQSPETRDSDASLVVAAVLVTWLSWSWREAVVLAVCVALFALFNAGRLRFLAWRPLLFLGGISYTLYLLHQEIGYILIDGFERTGLSSVASICLATVIVIALAWILSRFVEKPANRYLRGAYAKWRDSAGTTAIRSPD